MTPRAPLWLAVPSRFAALTPRSARIAAGLLALLLLASLTSLWQVAPLPDGREPAASGEQRDVVLYTSIVAAVRHGEDYYVAAARGLRAGNYPLRPFFTFRLPTLAVIQAHLPQLAVLPLLDLLAGMTALAWAMRLRAALRHWRATAVGLALLAGGLMAFVQPTLWPFHEIWAGLLIALSLALWRPGRHAEAVALGLAAALIRETGLLYLLIMAGLAWRSGSRREALAWGAAIVALGLALAAHALAVADVTNPLDPASPGWNGLLGFGFFLQALRAATVLAIVPMAVAAPLIVLALFGWAAWRDPLGARVLATILGYALLLGLFARSDTFYWVLMIAPLPLVGLVFAPDGLRDLARRPLDKRRITVTRVTR